MKIISFNVNGLRSRLHQLAALVEKHDPDIIGLQETKVQDTEFPLAAIQSLGYEAAFYGQKTHYGVALLFRRSPLEVQAGFPGEGNDAQRRLIAATFRLHSGAVLKVINGYFPQGESRDHPVKFPDKRRFYAELQNHLDECCDPDGSLVLMGDFNVAPGDEDIGIGEENARRWLRTGKTSFLPEEREWFAGIRGWGLHDSFRIRNPMVSDRFSWFDYRSRGFESEPKRGLRIDHILLTAALQESCLDAGIDYEIRGMEKPSDHCPVWAELALE